MTNAQTEARAIVEEYEKRPKTSILINLIATALAAKDAELAEVHQQYVDANEARIDAEAQLAERAGGVKVLQAELDWYSQTEHGALDGIPYQHVAHVIRVMLSRLTTEPAAPQEAEAVGSKRVRDAERIVRSFAEDRLKSTTQWALDPRYLITLCDAVRSRPAEQAVTEAMVERLAQHLALDHIAIDDRAEYSWDAANEQWRQSWRRKARAALKAAMEAER